MEKNKTKELTLEEKANQLNEEVAKQKAEQINVKLKAYMDAFEELNKTHGCVLVPRITYYPNEAPRIELRPILINNQ